MQTQIEALKIQLDQLESELESMECSSKKKKMDKESVSQLISSFTGCYLFHCPEYQLYYTITNQKDGGVGGYESGVYSSTNSKAHSQCKPCRPGSKFVTTGLTGWLILVLTYSCSEVPINPIQSNGFIKM